MPGSNFGPEAVAGTVSSDVSDRAGRLLGIVSTNPAVPTPANILDGHQEFTATAVATTIITIPANRVWQGEIDISCSTQVAAATVATGQAWAVVSLSGVGATPAPGNLFAVRATIGANAATGAVGDGDNNFGTLRCIIAAGANPVLVQVVVTIGGSSGNVDVTAAGVLIA